MPVRSKEDNGWCPAEHIEDLKDHMTYAFDGFNILVIGYQAIDDDVLSLFRSAGRPVRSLLVVDKSRLHAMQIAERFCESLPSHFVDRSRMAFDGDFKQFAQSDAVARYVASI